MPENYTEIYVNLIAQLKSDGKPELQVFMEFVSRPDSDSW